MKAKGGQIVELIGLPGSGKTCLADRLTSERSMPVLSNPGGAFAGRWVVGRLKAFLMAPLFSTFLFFALTFRRHAKFENFRRLFSVQRNYISLAQSRHENAVFIDEGPLHALYSALYGTTSSFLSDFFLGLVIKSLMRNEDMYLFINPDKSECVQRFSKRSSTTSRFSAKSTKQDISEFMRDNTYQQLKYLVQQQRAEALISFKTIDEAYEYIISDSLGEKHGCDHK